MPNAPATRDPGGLPFFEAPAWKAVAGGWQPLFASFSDLGFSVEWHDFRVTRDVDWARSFHPGSIELCLNLAGLGLVRSEQGETRLGPRTLAVYYAGDPPLQALRRAGERHQFLTVEFSRAFLVRQFGEVLDALHPVVRDVALGRPMHSQVALLETRDIDMSRLVESLRRPPVYQPAQRVWFACKATELASQCLFQPAGGELFCTRARRVQRERVEQAQALLREHLQEPPPLEELARRVGCSPFYLSRLFSRQVGLTLQQYLRQIRLERAAELLRTGQCNVTEAAFSVGYNSLSHFSTAFHAAYGCCPGLYALGISRRPGVRTP